jgi:hypothetical protein
MWVVKKKPYTHENGSGVLTRPEVSGCGIRWVRSAHTDGQEVTSCGRRNAGSPPPADRPRHPISHIAQRRYVHAPKARRNLSFSRLGCGRARRAGVSFSSTSSGAGSTSVLAVGDGIDELFPNTSGGSVGPIRFDSMAFVELEAQEEARKRPGDQLQDGVGAHPPRFLEA